MDKSDEKHRPVWKNKTRKKLFVGYAVLKLLNILKSDIKVREANVLYVRWIFPWNKTILHKIIMQIMVLEIPLAYEAFLHE